MPNRRRIKRIAYGCLVGFLFVYVLFVLAFIFRASQFKSQQTSIPGRTTLSSRCSYTPVADDATRNQLLTFYGHKDLLKNPEVFRPSSSIINPINYNFTINSPEACPPNSKPILFIMILTQHEHYLERQAIRETWGRITRDQPWPGKKLRGNVRMIFLLGESNNKTLNAQVQVEASQKKDIVQADFQESYFNLTLKVLMGYKWVRIFCPDTQFVMKMDEDTFSDIPRILSLLVSLEWSNTIYGPFSHSEKVVRQPKYQKVSKGAVSPEAYPLEWYPPHVKGNIYIMPKELAMQILNVSQYFPYMNIEDAHITGILAKVFDSRHINIPTNLYEKFPKGDPSFCDFALEKKIAAQGIYPQLVYNIWKHFENTKLCGIVSEENIIHDNSSRHDIVANTHVQHNFTSSHETHKTGPVSSTVRNS